MKALNKTVRLPSAQRGGDAVLREVWQAKDSLSAAHGHSVQRLFLEARKRRSRSGHPIVDFSKTPKRRAS